jgi:CheY-like chemotaxis protein
VSASRLTVLVVDDDARNCELLGRLLEMEGCHVIRALNVGEGLQRAADERLDLVLLDVRMPGIDGFAACASLRADPVLGSLPIYLSRRSTTVTSGRRRRGAGRRACSASRTTGARCDGS